MELNWVEVARQEHVKAHLMGALQTFTDDDDYDDAYQRQRKEMTGGLVGMMALDPTIRVWESP